MDKKNNNQFGSIKAVDPKIYYIPYDELDLNNQNPNQKNIDIYKIVKTIWIEKKIFFLAIVMSLAIGIFTAFLSTKKYQSYSILIPEIGTTTESRTEQLLRRYGSGLGISAITQIPEGSIPPLLYPNIVHSTPFQMELLERKLKFQSLEVSITYKEYIQKYNKPSPVDLIKSYTIGLPRKTISYLIEVLNINKTIALEGGFDLTENTNILRISKEDKILIDGLSARIYVEQNPENGLISTIVTMPDPLAAAELNFAVVELLKKYITDYQLQKVREDLEFTRRIKEESEKQFYDSQLALADFLDRNKVLSTSRAKVELEQLQDEKNLAFGIYNTVSQRLEQTKLKLNEQRPTFKEVQPVTVPTEYSSPKRALIIVISFVMGSLLGLFWIFFGKKTIKLIKDLPKE